MARCRCCLPTPPTLSLRHTGTHRHTHHASAHARRSPAQVISRFTWKESKSDVPAKKSDAFKEYEYKMVRILDKNGKVNQGAIEDAKKIYGSNVIFLGDPTF